MTPWSHGGFRYIKNDCITVGYDLIPAHTTCQRMVRVASILPQGQGTAGTGMFRNTEQVDARRLSGSSRRHRKSIDMRKVMGLD